jgi:indolepyruvate ferredoxin oxidoreductase
VTLLSGVEALVRLLVVRRQLDERDGLTTATMVSGYPGSPLGTFDLVLEAQRDLLDAHGVVHRPGLNEELAAATVWGSQMGAPRASVSGPGIPARSERPIERVPYRGIDGVAGVWYGKGPGLDRAGDAMKHANAMGSGPNGGVVMFCGDDPTAKSSTLTCDSQYTFEDACMPVLYPGDQQDVLDVGVHAFRMSRYSGAWVGLKIVTAVADGLGTVDLDLARHRPEDPPHLTIDGEPWRHRPLATIGPHQVPDQELLVVEHRLRAAQAYVRHNRIDRLVGAPPGAALGVVCAGKTYFDVVQALADLDVPIDALADVGVRVLKLAMTYPLVPDTILEFAATVDEVVVIEEKRPFVETQLRSILHEAGSPVRVAGKRDATGATLASSVGELDPAAVADVLTALSPVLAARRAATPARAGLPLLAVPGRAPAFCSGCPHNRSTVVPAGALVGGGVGCHGIMYFEARHQGMKSLAPTPMGAEGVPWIGLAPFVDEPHLIQNLGDGTLSHSGTLAIRASVAAGVDVTFKILYNRAVAMTGGQDVTGLLDVPALTRALEAEGVRRIVVCAEDPTRYGRSARWASGVEVLGRDRLPDAQERLRAVPGVTVIVYDQQCAAEARRLRKRGELEEPPARVVINEAVCEGCGDCSTKSNCLSVLPHVTEFGEKRMIHDLSCNRDYTCLEGDCPSFVTLTARSRGRRRAAPAERRTARAALPSGTLPMTSPAAIDGSYGIYFTGIGGTGVVTANRILAAAAEAAGLVVEGLDQTGLSQKAGAVTSHLHLAADRDALGSAAVGSQNADLYLSGDILQAASPLHLAKVRPGHTIAVIDRDVAPTAAMLQSDLAAPDPDALEGMIRARVGEGAIAFVDSTRIAEDLLGNHLLANVVVLGAAYQLGGLPLSAADLDAAMGRQGAAAAANRDAFAWGRWAVHAPEMVAARLADAAREVAPSASAFDPSARATEQATRLVDARKLPGELHDLIVRRTAQVVDYQSRARAERFLALVEQVAAHDGAAHGWELTRAVAASWFKLLTYKDEYEVARLHLKVDYGRVAADLGIEGPYSVRYHLHPPTLRRMGRTKKLPMGRPYEVAFHALRAMRRVRGTPFDVFGWDRDRRLERALVREYEQLVTESLTRAPAVPYEVLVALAESPMAIKGYGEIKERAVEAWRVDVERLQLSRAAAPV